MSSVEKFHFWQHCNHCGISPIPGNRYECQTCPAGPDIDYCSRCYLLYQNGEVEHPKKKPLKTGEVEHKFLVRAGATSCSVKQWLQVDKTASQAPDLPQRFVVRMEFRVGYQSVIGGYGFIVNTQNGRLLITALHVLDEIFKIAGVDATDKNDNYTGGELANVIDSINLYDVMQQQWMFYELGGCGKLLALPNSRLGDLEPISFRDICTFSLGANTKVNAANLANSSPQIGSSVWLVANISINVQTKQAVVVEKTEYSFIFRYLDESPLPKASSGAPIVDEFGNVVAINIGTAIIDGTRFGHGNHVESINNHLSQINEKNY